MFCIYCGKEIAKNASFCPYCGKKLEENNNSAKKKPLGFLIGMIAAGMGVLVLAIGGFILWSSKEFSKLHPDGQVSAVKEEVDAEEYATANNNRPSFLSSEDLVTVKEDLNPCVDAYEVIGDLDNVVYSSHCYVDDETKELLCKNLFAVINYSAREFYPGYEDNRYFQVPNFVTVDSLMHSYHLYFAYLLKKTEKNYLYDNLVDLSNALLEESEAQYEALKGTEWEDAALRNMAFFSVGAYLLEDGVAIPDAVSDVAEEELAKIMKAEGIEICLLTNENEDYTQYIPRGYYEGDATMEAYFRAMMWYGRIPFKTEDEATNRSALLMTLAMKESKFSNWESAYEITSFFAGASDDLGYYEYMPVIENIYGENIEASDLAGKTSEWNQFVKQTEKMEAPQINSIPVNDGEEPVISSFRFMGQRFSIDADIMQRLVYSNIKENSKNEKRMLPDVLDVATALGSDTAEGLLREQGDFEYGGYEENMDTIKKKYEEAPESVWKTSLYASWLYTLTPLLEDAPEGYPSYMRSEEWNKKNIETFAGSYTELKHDTVLYSKQVMAEMGGGDDEVIDDRGFVDPQPLIYARFANLSRQTKNGLDQFGMISKEDQDNLELLAELAEKLLHISEKELENETLTDEEYDLIRNYGGNLEHFWKDAMIGITDNSSANPDEFPAALVTDIATDPNGSVLEIATGGVNTMWVIAPVDGELKLCRGFTYSFYQFPWDMSDRLTDTSWKEMIGIELNSDGEYNYEHGVEQPWWTQSYHVNW